MEKQDMPSAMDEIRKLQEALKREDDGSGSADEIRPKKTKLVEGRLKRLMASSLTAGPMSDPQKKIVVQNPTKQMRKR